MTAAYTLFEVSWEVGNRIGGVHTSVSTKARALDESLGTAHITVGPWLLGAGAANAVLEHDPAYDGFAETCRAAGFPVRIGRWRIPGRPRTILIDFSRLLTSKDEVLAELWNTHGVDSLFGGWDYLEPVLFGHAAGQVIDLWWRHFLAGRPRPTVALFHDWQSASGVLHLKAENPAIGTVFNVHSTVVGGALCAAGATNGERVGGRTAAEVAESLHVTAEHSLARAAARAADGFTAISDITADEAAIYYGRKPDGVVPNGIDQGALVAALDSVSRKEGAARLRRFASRFCGEDLTEAVVVVTGARYEFHNKGFDLLLSACAELADKPGRPIVLLLSVPAGNAGPRREVLARLASEKLTPTDDPGLATHLLFDAETDPIATLCAELGLSNAPGSRVRVIHVPVYLDGDDGVLDLSYLAAVQGADLACFPSLYESWGYTPQESLALGVPTVTTDCAGFGLWALEQGLGPDQGLFVLRRREAGDAAARAELVGVLERVVGWHEGDSDTTASCSDVVRASTWADVLPEHERTWELAADAARARIAERGVEILRRAVPLPVRGEEESARPHLFELRVRPRLDPALDGLRELAWNWRWTWHPGVRALFREVSLDSWEACGHSPVRLLRTARQADLDACAADAAYVARVEAALDEHRASLERLADEDVRGTVTRERPVAYFCAEFGIHETLPIYSGGLGVLAGDHLRAASDLGLPLVGVGILYRKGYFRQRLWAGSVQTALPAPFDLGEVALSLVKDAQGEPLEVSLELPGSTLVLRAWRARIGQVALYLLDADVPANRPEDRELTHALYAGDSEFRLRQEMILGRGGVRLLAAMGIDPSVYHLNEGHGAFVAVERASRLHRDQGLTFEEAREVVRASTVFTTHTPVPAGHDRFEEDLIRRYFSDVAGWLGIPWERFYGLGVAPGGGAKFNMTVLALRFAAFVNGVSRLHGDVTRELLERLYPTVLPSDFPVTSITNGVHLARWAAPAIGELLGAADRPVEGSDFPRAAELSAERVWETRLGLRERFQTALRAELERSFHDREDSADVLEDTLEALDPDALYIGFARRFATYKRAGLIFRDLDRLRELLCHPERPVRLLVAGKAHPKDRAAQELLAEIGRIARRDEFVGRVVVLEDYDLQLARLLLQGVDVWLNTPRAPHEASGTSGMKAAVNGALNLSIADGWWVEAADGGNGWTIGDGRLRDDPEAQDIADAASLFALLEDEVVPLFYERDAAGIPLRWVHRVAHSMATIPPVYDTVRMVAEYATEGYAPRAASHTAVAAHAFALAREWARGAGRLERGMSAVRIVAASVSGAERAHPGEELALRVDVDTGDLEPGELIVELVAGVRGVVTPLEVRERTELSPTGRGAEGEWTYEGVHRVERVGVLHYGLRVRPRHRDGDAMRVDDRLVWA